MKNDRGPTHTGVREGSGGSGGSERGLFADSPYRTCRLESGVSVSWYQRLEDVPRGWGSGSLIY